MTVYRKRPQPEPISFHEDTEEEETTQVAVVEASVDDQRTFINNAEQLLARMVTEYNQASREVRQRASFAKAVRETITAFASLNQQKQLLRKQDQVAQTKDSDLIALLLEIIGQNPALRAQVLTELAQNSQVSTGFTKEGDDSEP